MSLLGGFRVFQLGPGLAAAACGRLFSDAGADVSAIGAAPPSPFMDYLNFAKRLERDDALDWSAADLMIAEGGPSALAAAGHDVESLRRRNPSAVILLISNYGQTGPRADDPASDLTLFGASGMARLLTGQVTNLSEPPVRAVGEQSAFIGAAAAACAGMQAALADPTQENPGAVIDISMQEALATLAVAELARTGATGKSWSRKREKDGNGATVTILPASDGYVAISPREERQWAAWVKAMGDPAWAHDPRFARKPNRVANWDALHALLSEWSRGRDKQSIADLAQAAHVPSFPLRELAEHLASPQLESRGFFREIPVDGRPIKAPSAPFAVSFPAAAPSPGDQARPIPGQLPLSGVRVLDFSWVIAGPTATRHLAAMGADVIKVEAPGPGDPGRATGLHEVLGQAKEAIVLDLKQPQAVEIAKALAARSDILIENFATGVMERLGLGAAELHAINPDLIYLSASGLGRTGPEAGAVAYGTLLQSYSGFAGLNRHPDRPPRIGFAWLDPMCGLLLPFAAAAALWRRRRAGGGARIDFSMIEAMLWTMAKPLIALQCDAPAEPAGNASDAYAPHGVFSSAGDDQWIGLAVTSDEQWRRLCALVPGLNDMARLTLEGRFARRPEIDAALEAWSKPLSPQAAEDALLNIGVAAAPVAASADLVGDPHLNARGFWAEENGAQVPGLPWRASCSRRNGPAPAMGADTDRVLETVLSLSAEERESLRNLGAIA